jgi:hypothetical protein
MPTFAALPSRLTKPSDAIQALRADVPACEHPSLLGFLYTLRILGLAPFYRSGGNKVCIPLVTQVVLWYHVSLSFFSRLC